MKAIPGQNVSDMTRRNQNLEGYTYLHPGFEQIWSKMVLVWRKETKTQQAI